MIVRAIVRRSACTTYGVVDSRQPASPSPIPLGLVFGSGIVAFALAMRRRPVQHG